MTTSSGTFYIQVCVLAVMCGVFAVVVAQTAEDERRPYKFGFTIENMQHRQEEKDERGIIMGEYGFITADGWYLTTIYATDEEGRFKILGRRRERVGPPLDNFTPQVTLMDDFSPQSSSTRPPTLSPTSNPITISSPRPFQTAAPTTFRPTTFRPSTASSPFVQTTAAFQPSRQQGGIPGCGGCIIPTTTSRPSVSPDFVSSTAGFRPSGSPGNFAASTSRPGSFNGDRNPSGPGIFNSDRNPSGPGNFNSGSTNRPGSLNSDRNPSGPGNFNSGSTNRPGSFNSDRNPSGPGSFNSDRNPSGPGGFSSSTNRPGNFNSDRNPSGPGNFNSGSTSRPGNFNSDRFPSSGPGSLNSGSTNRPGSFNSDRNPSGPGNNDDDFNSGNGGSYNRPSNRPNSSRPSGPFGSATASTPTTAIPFTRPTTRYPGSGLSSTTSRPITTGGYNQPSYNNNNNNNNRPSGPSGFGDNQQGESGLNYRFNYTTDFQGHHETGYKDGSKMGGYFYNGPDGVGQRVTYEANEFGYQPQIINVQLSSNETPRQDEDRNAQLKGSEFLWFKR